MAEATKSVLLVDYDSIHRSLAAGDSAAAERLTQRLAAWIGAIEAGTLFAEKPEAQGRRRVLIRRCYADPANLATNRAAFLANGFQVVDCPPIEGRGQDTATIHIVLDCIDALEHPTGYEEFILLSADSDLSPLLIRLRAHNRTSAIYATMATADSYRAIADSIIEEPRFIAVLMSDEEPAGEDEGPAEDRPPVERSQIEALARKISSATNVPLFAPRTFADLFRHLVEEIAENGYHFQTTAENVANRMAKAGRNVSRRQAVFVVKGLALKGHVFSTGDTPERLADVFREQVLYLAENAGLSLDDDERNALSAWIVGQVPTSAGDARKSRPRQESASDNKPAAKAAEGENGRDNRKKPGKPSDTDKPRGEAKPAAEKPKPASLSSSASAARARPTQPETTKATATSGSSRPTSTTTDTARDKPDAASEAGPSGTSSRQVAPAPALSTKAQPAATAKAVETDDDGNTDVESSILAAIAEAVDVLVEDSGGKAKATAEAPQAKASPPAEKPAARREPEIVEPEIVEPEVVESDDIEEGSDDIGDEIQRIIASYSRNRSKGN